MSVRLISAHSRHFVFQFSVFLNHQNGGVRSKTQIFGYPNIVDTFSPTFMNPIFRFSRIVRYENLDYKNPKCSNIFSMFTSSQIQKLEFQKFEILIQAPVFSIFVYSQIRKLGLQKIWHPSFRYLPFDFQTSIFSIFAYSQIRKLGFQEIRDFQTSVCSIFAYSQIRKLGSEKSGISKRPVEHPVFLIFINIKIQELRSFRK